MSRRESRVILYRLMRDHVHCEGAREVSGDRDGRGPSMPRQPRLRIATKRYLL